MGGFIGTGPSTSSCDSVGIKGIRKINGPLFGVSPREVSDDNLDSSIESLYFAISSRGVGIGEVVVNSCFRQPSLEWDSSDFSTVIRH